MKASKILSFHKFLIFGIPAAIIFCQFLLLQSSLFQNKASQLIVGITLDFVITVPLVYFLLIRRTKIPKFTVASVLVVSIILASFIIPSDQQSLLSMVKHYAIPVIESGVFGVLIRSIYKIRKSFKNTNAENLDFYDTLKLACAKILPAPIDKLLASEVSVFYFIFSFRRRIQSKGEFTYHQKSGIQLTLSVLLAVASMELFVTHILVEKFSVTLAWVLSFLTAYSFLQVIALLRSLSKRPHVIDCEQRTLKLRYGFFTETVVGLDAIEKVELTSRTPKQEDHIKNLSPMGPLSTHNVILHLKQEGELHSLYGKAKRYKTLCLYVDKKVHFKEEIETYLSDINVV